MAQILKLGGKKLQGLWFDSQLLKVPMCPRGRHLGGYQWQLSILHSIGM